MAGLGLRPARRTLVDGNSRAQRPEYRQPVPPDQSDSFGKQILDTGASGLSHVLGVLDKPGQVVRGALAGHGLSSLSIRPVQRLGRSDHRGRPRLGRDLTNQWGLTRKKRSGLGGVGSRPRRRPCDGPAQLRDVRGRASLTDAAGRPEDGGLEGIHWPAVLKGFDGVSSAFGSASDRPHAINQGKKIASPAAEGRPVVWRGLRCRASPGSGFPSAGRESPSGPGPGHSGTRGQAGRGRRLGQVRQPGGPGRGFAVRLRPATERCGHDDQRGAVKRMDPALQALKVDARADRQCVIAGLDPLVSGGAFPQQDITGAARSVAEGVPSRHDPILQTEVQGRGRAHPGRERSPVRGSPGGWCPAQGCA